MRFLFISAQLPGHLDWGGYLPTAIELRSRGHDILWASGTEVKALVEASQLPFHTLNQTGWRWPPPSPLQPKPEMDPTEFHQLRAERALDQWLDETKVSAAVTELLALAKSYQPDLIVSEMFMASAGIVAEMMELPFVVAGWPAMQPLASTQADPLVTIARQRFQQLCRQFKIHGANWTQSGPPALCSPTLHITYWSQRWFTNIAILPQTHHVGSSATKAQPKPQSQSKSQPKPHIFITLGTSFNNDPNFFITAARAVEQIGGIPLIALGTKLAAAQLNHIKNNLPKNAILHERIQFDSILPHIAGAIHHGGAGTTHALVIHAIPQIVVPHAADQIYQAQGVKRSGIGVHLPPKQMTVDLLVQILGMILPADSPAQHNAKALQAEFATLGGVPRAADLLEKHLR